MGATPTSPSGQSVQLVASAVSFYIVTSITMVLANKWVLAGTPGLPLFFLWLQLVLAVILLTASHAVGLIKLPTQNQSLYSPLPVSSLESSASPDVAGTSWWSRTMPQVSYKKARRLWPLIAVNVVGLASNTLCLKFIDASLYQVARSLILPFTVALQWVFLRQSSSVSVLVSCAIVCSGFFVGLFGDKQDETTAAIGVTFLGVFFGVFSSMTTAMHAIIIKSSLDVVRGNTMELVWYNNVLSSVVMIPLVFFAGEFHNAWDLLYSDTDALQDDLTDTTVFMHQSAVRTFILGTLVTGAFGFLINLAGFFQIKVTSPVTHMISSAVRGVLQTFLAVWLFSEVLTSSRLLGIVLILVGSSLYTWIKSNETSSIPAAKPSYAPNDRNEDVSLTVSTRRSSVD